MLFLLCTTVISCNQDIAGTVDDGIQSTTVITTPQAEGGDSCDRGFFSADGLTPCEPCPIGTYQNEPGQTSCKAAEPGSFVDFLGAAAPSLCSIGTFSNVFGAAQCTACAVGETTNGLGAIFCILIDNNPTTKADCKNGGWEEYGFKNQGQCIRFVNTGKDSRI